MFWFKSPVILSVCRVGGLFLLACIISCKPDVKETGTGLKYFDLKGFLSKDTALLNKSYKKVNKTVTHNGKSEQKTVIINDWGKELDLFFKSDINKPAWKNSYSVVADKDLILYKAKDPELQTRELMIRFEKKKVKWILIFNRNQNILYKTTEKLTYYPDSLYAIEKMQKVKLMGGNIYQVSGVIDK